MKTRNAENPDKSRLSAKFLASRKGFEPPTPALGGQTYPLEGVCNIRFLHKIRIFLGFKVKTKLFSVTFADFTAIYSKQNETTTSKTRCPRLFLFLRSKYNKSKVIFKISARKQICFQNCIDYSKRFGYNR